MIRSFTLICVMLFLISGFYDYQITHKVSVIDQQISDLRHQTADTLGDSKMLQTEWSWLNRPDRLQPFAAQFLALQNVAPTQYVPMDQLAQRLPPAGSPPATAAELAAKEAAATDQSVETRLAQAAPVAAPAAPAKPAPAAPVLALNTPPHAQPAAQAVAQDDSADEDADAPAPAARPAPAVRPADVKRVSDAAPAARKPARKTELADASAHTDLPASRPGNASLADIERDLVSAPVAPKVSTHTALAANESGSRPIAPPAAPHHSTRPVIQPTMVADNLPPRAAAPRSVSALGTGGSALPPPVAMSNADWRNDQ